MKKALYLECSSGISGDMSVAALLNLGADEKKLLAALESLPLDGYRIEVSTVHKSGIAACDFHVILEHENHDHDMEYLHGHEAPKDTQLQGHTHCHGKEHKHCHHEGHDHYKEHDHVHVTEHCHHNHEEHGHDHCHPHFHRNLNDILVLLRSGSLTPGALSLAEKIFRILAEGEAEAHGVPLEQVHFHEVGAVDSIIDIAAFAICLDMLGYSEVFLPLLCEGTGTIRCQHGILPIPVPAVSNIVRRHHLPLSILNARGEFVTPTGAAIAAAISTSDQLPHSFRILRIGVGAGKRNYEMPGILRAMEIEY